MKLVARYLVLAFLSAITAEFLLGDQWLGGAAVNIPGQGAELLLYAAYYGSAAVLIREVARRTGRGWPTILLLALAFGLLEEGIIDQSLFNPDFVGEHLLRFGFVPALGIAGPWTIFVLSLHVIWSIGAPIAIAENLFASVSPRRSPVEPQVQAPWLGAPAIVGAGILYIFGALAIFEATVNGEHFMATPGQLVASLVGSVILVVVALTLPRTAARGARPFGVAVAIGALDTSAHVSLERVGGFRSPWIVVSLELGILALGVLLATQLRLDVLGLAAGAILTYCWLGLAKAVPLGVGPTIEQVVIVVVVLAATVVAVRRRRRSRS